MKINLTNVFFFPITVGIRKKLLLIIMRTFIFLLGVSMFGFTPNTILSQNTKIKIDTDKVLTVDEVFNLIEEQTNYTFIYQVDIFKDFPKIYLNKGVIRANKLLKKSFQGKDFNFSFTSNNTIVINKGVDKVQATISGVVTDKNNIPLSGVNVLVNTDEKGTATDIEGRYKISVAIGDKLSFSYIGFASQEFTITEEATTINVTLLEDNTELDEVLVTGYEKLTRERATGSFGTLNSETLEKRVESNVLTELVGTVSGVLVEGDNITIRGVNTFNSNTQPLIVVDGFPIEGEEFFRNNGRAGDLTSLINSDDVESITVLKDAAAASIWGARAANGVIVITTKQAKGKTIRVNVFSRVKYQEQTNWDKSKFASTSSIIDGQLFALQNGVDVPQQNSGKSELSQLWFDLNDPTSNNPITQAQFDVGVNALRNQDYRKNFQDAFERNDFRQEYGVNVSGGSKFHDFYISAKFINSDLTRRDRNNKDYNLNVKNNFKIGKKIKITSSINLKRFNSESGLVNRSFGRAYTSLVNPDGTPSVLQRDFSPEFLNSFTSRGGYVDWDFVPLEDVNHTEFTSESTDIRFQLWIEAELLKGLTYKSGFQYEYGTIENLELSDKFAYDNRDFYNTYALSTDNGDGTYNFTPQVLWAGQRIQDESVINNFTWRNQLDFDRIFGKHKIKALAGIEVRTLKYEFFEPSRLLGYDDRLQTFSRYDFPIIERFDGTSGQIRPDDPNFNEQETRYLSYYGNAGYTFDNRFDVTGSYRVDLTNIFGTDPEFRNRPLWSVGLGWTVSNENFFNADWVDHLRIRTTYGVNGNSNLTGNPFLRVRTFTFLGNPTGSIVDPPNPSLRWEKTEVTNIGIDFSIFKNKLSGAIEYYNKYSSDLLGRVPTDPTNGFESGVLNTSELSNRGVDISLNYKVFDKAFKWDANWNLGLNKGKVEKYFLTDPTATQLVSDIFTEFRIIGDPINALYAYEWGGLNENGDPTFVQADGTVLEATNATAATLNQEDARFIGSRIPTAFGGIRNFLSYKNFNLNVFVRYSLGHYKRVPTAILNSANFGSADVHQDFENRWQNPGDELRTDVPRQLSNSLDNRVYIDSDHLVAKADEVFLQEISLGYTFPKRILDKTPFKGIYASLHANNLGYLYVAEDTNLVPFNATYTFNINLNF